jgi:hypothetical protein
MNHAGERLFDLSRELLPIQVLSGDLLIERIVDFIVPTLLNMFVDLPIGLFLDFSDGGCLTHDLSGDLFLDFSGDKSSLPDLSDEWTVILDFEPLTLPLEVSSSLLAFINLPLPFASLPLTTVPLPLALFSLAAIDDSGTCTFRVGTTNVLLAAAASTFLLVSVLK